MTSKQVSLFSCNKVHNTAFVWDQGEWGWGGTLRSFVRGGFARAPSPYPFVCLLLRKAFLKGHSRLAHFIANLHITETRSLLLFAKYDKTISQDEQKQTQAPSTRIRILCCFFVGSAFAVAYCKQLSEIFALEEDKKPQVVRHEYKLAAKEDVNRVLRMLY